MPYRILFRRDTSTNWAQNNPTLAPGEPGFETDTGLLKIGNGNAVWNDLEYYLGPTGGTGASGPTGILGPTGPTGSVPAECAVTGSNDFYGDQTINGNLEINSGIYLNPQVFSVNSTIPDAVNGSLVGPITLTGSITIQGTGTLSIL